jgi:RNA polymerase sigma factor (sigma-70 family)
MSRNESLASDESQRWQELFDKARECWENGDQYGAEDHFSDLMDLATSSLVGRAKALLPPKWQNDAEDFAARALYGLWTKIEKGKPVKSARPLLYTILHNRIVDRLRSEPQVEIESADAAQGYWERHTLEERQYGSAEAVEQQTSDREIANTLLSVLPELERKVLMARFIEGLDIRETAASLRISEAKVKSIQRRAKERALEIALQRGISYDNS